MSLDPITEEILQEAKRTSRTTVSRQTKIKRATSQLASVEARKRNDSMYKRMIYFRDQYYKYRKMIHKKYSPRVRSKARR
ncbi:MAG: hypothetical protein KGD64_04025 [Candidatus Heimdallarchaeota archaeon]|jgi:hypothetical protein|nr:hypothetical protein [Candidatus Heimdallarchaeota archaeon]